MQFLKRTWWLLLMVVACGLLGWFMSAGGFNRIHEMRQMERVPKTQIMAVIPGEVILEGRVELGPAVLTSPDTKTRCVYYDYHVERYVTDSDGNGSWETVSRTRDVVPFILRDQTGLIAVIPSANVDFTVWQSHRRRSGDLRYTEYRIDPGARIYLFGMAVPVENRLMAVKFNVEGSFQPIISRGNEDGQRLSMTQNSLLITWFGILFWALMVWAVFGVFRWHNTVFYLVMVTLVVGAPLVFMGMMLVERDLRDAHQRLERHQAFAHAEFEQVLERSGVPWSGAWAELGSLDEPRYATIDAPLRARLARIRIDLALATLRTNQHKARFPEVVIAPWLGLERFEPIALPAQDLELAVALDSRRPPARLSWIYGLLCMLVGAVMAFFSVRAGFKKIWIKRTCENLPTSPVNGVTYGAVELNGRAELLPDVSAMKGPVSGRSCVYYSYEISEKDGDDKYKRVHYEAKYIVFGCRDESGVIPVVLKGASIFTNARSSRKKGSRLYEEKRIEIGADIYVLGMAGIDPATHDSLCIGEDVSGEVPFLVETRPEDEVQFALGRYGTFYLNLGMNGVMLMGMAALAMHHSLGALDYFAAALVACLYLVACRIAMMYNDLVFLRRRVQRNWANIDVALKKRFDLFGQLQAVVEAHGRHEQALQAGLSQLRNQQSTGSALDPVEAGQVVETQNQLTHQFLGLFESNPALGADESYNRLMGLLRGVEDEISLMREGYNDAVEHYNTAIARFPEVAIAVLLRFRRSQSLAAIEGLGAGTGDRGEKAGARERQVQGEGQVV